MKQETEVQGRPSSWAEAMKKALAGGHVEGQGWRMEYLRLLARARADGLLRHDQVKQQLPADLLLAVEALADELRGGSHVMPLVVLGNDWDFAADDAREHEPAWSRLSRIRPAEPDNFVWPWWAVLAVAAAGFAIGALVFH
jgi:hypothetical protein